jgi:hypothetical protein
LKFTRLRLRYKRFLPRFLALEISFRAFAEFFGIASAVLEKDAVAYFPLGFCFMYF